MCSIVASASRYLLPLAGTHVGHGQESERGDAPRLETGALLEVLDRLLEVPAEVGDLAAQEAQLGGRGTEELRFTDRLLRRVEISAPGDERGPLDGAPALLVQRVLLDPRRLDGEAVHEAAEVLGHRRRALVAQVGVLVHGLEADGLEVGGNLPVQLARRPGLLVEDLRDDLVAPLTVERRMQRQRLVEGGAEGVDVRAVVERGAPGGDLLGRHVDRRAHELAGDGHARLLEHAREAEVVDAHPPVRREEEVRGLDVVVDDPVFVRVVERLGHLGQPSRDVVEVFAPRAEGGRRFAGASLAGRAGRGARLPHRIGAGDGITPRGGQPGVDRGRLLVRGRRAREQAHAGERLVE